MSTTIHLTADNFNGSPDFFNHRDPLPERLRDMTQDRWNLLSNARREVCDAIREQFYDDPRGAKRALADLGIRHLWAHAKRWGFSSIGRELDFNGTNEILNFMRLTEAEYNEHLENEDY